MVYEQPEIREAGDAQDFILSNLTCTGCDCHCGGKCSDEN